MDKNKMIFALFKSELSYLIENQFALDDVCNFLVKGGFNNWNDADIIDEYNLLSEGFKNE